LLFIEFSLAQLFGYFTVEGCLEGIDSSLCSEWPAGVVQDSE